MYKVLIIDDEPLARSVVKECLQQHPQLIVAEECGNGFEGLKAIQQHEPDLIFLDVQMPKITGFEMLELIDHPPHIIFTTAYDEYAMKAFEANAVDYLLKPFSQERFNKAISKWLDLNGKPEETINTNLLQQVSGHPAQQQRVVVKTGTKIKIIPLHEIHYLEAADDYVKIYTNEGSFLKKKTMAYFEDILDSSLFVRTHRSYIINLQEITRIDQYEKENHIAMLRSGAKVPVSKSGYPRIKAILGL